MKIISKEEIDKQNALNYAFYEAQKRVLEKMAELKKADDAFTGSAEQVAVDETLTALVVEAQKTASALGKTYDAAADFARYLKRQERMKKTEQK